MRKLTQWVLVSAALVATPVMAETKIAVLDFQAALFESDVAKRHVAAADKKYKPDLDRAKSLEAEMKRIQDRVQKDGTKMQQAERERVELDFKQKARDLQALVQKLNEARQNEQRTLLVELEPKVVTAAQEIAKAGNYDVVMERSTLVYFKPQSDITRQVVERVNKQR